jgi:hypothetical protein
VAPSLSLRQLKGTNLCGKSPQGKLTTINAIREAIAKRHGGTIACPLTPGIFSWIAANAAEEQRDKGENNITPYWRTLKTGGLLNDKYSGGVDAQKWRLEKEGHRIVPKDKKFVVANYEKTLVQF